MSDCTHDCNTCGVDCPSRAQSSLMVNPLPTTKINKIVAVVSGKGGVGKSMVTALLAVLAQRNGFQTAVLDADITGPSIPKMFGLRESATGTEQYINPVVTKTGIKTMSINALLEDETDPVVWRGPVIAGTVKQFWSDVTWGKNDVMFIDMPPGTGDVPLTVFQSIPIDGIVLVTTPQELVSMIVEKALKMAEMMNIPVLGIVENMSYITCPDCDKKIFMFGEGKAQSIAKDYNTEILGQIPMNPKLAGACDKGFVEMFSGDWLDEAIKTILPE